MSDRVGDEGGVAAQPGIPVDVRWNAVLADLKAIGKNSQNKQQGFNYRSIDDALDALHPLFAKHGVHVIPVRQVAERGDLETAKGTLMHVCYITVDWQIRGIDGDLIEAQTLGEGSDVFDKSTSKAQTMAFKYLLWPATAMATNEDPDGETPEASVARSGSTAAGKSPNPASRSSRPSSRAADPDSKVGLIVHLAKACQMTGDGLKAFVQETLALDEPNEDLNELDHLQQTVIVEALRAKEKEGAN